MARVEHIAEGVTLYLGDCRDILPGIDYADHVITDPPYEKEAHRADLFIEKPKPAKQEALL
jgi:DNA modification methylase